MRWPFARQSAALSAPPARVVSATAQAVAADVADEKLTSYVARLARDTFAIISNPRRRRQRRGSGDYHRDYQTVDELRRVSRWQEDHAGTYAGPLFVWETHLIGQGPEWVPATSNEAWNRAAALVLAADLADRKHDARRRWDWGPWLKLLARSIVRDGQMGVAHSATGAAQLLEAERIVDVDVTSAGQVAHWKIADWKGGQLNIAGAYPVPASMIDVCQIVTRTSQWFGVPLTCSSLDDHDGIADLWTAEIDTAAESVRPWMVIEHEGGSHGLPGGQTIPETLAAGQDASGEPRASGGRDTAPAGWIRSANGNIMGVPAGLKATPHQPDRPNLDVPEFCKAMLRIFSLVLLPYEILFGDQGGVNHSNGRGITRMANRMLDCFWKAHLDRPATRIAHGLLRAAMLDGRLEWNSEYKLGKWKRDPIPEHDRVKERQADALDRANGTATLKDLLGETWQATMRQHATELDAAAELVAAHNAKHPTAPITIADIYGDPGGSASLALQMLAKTPAEPEVTHAR